jgi:hypothetical protein
MLEQLGGSPQDEDETETPEGSPDPTVLLAAAAGRFEDHPLFPRADGTPEIREIKFVSFCRKRTGDQAMQNCPEDIPARDVRSWGQVVEWWGGGEYKAIAKDAKHRMVAWYPNGNGDWMTFDGDSKPFVLRSGKGYSAPGRAAAPASATPAPAAPEPAPAPAPTSQEAMMGMMAQVLQEIRNARVAPAPPAADSALVAMIQAQATQATATTQANAQMMQTLLSVVAQRPAETAARPAEPTTLALQLIGGLQKLVPAPAPPPAPAPGLAEQIPLIKALRDLYQPAAPAAPANELQPFVDIFGQVMAADAARTQAERAQAVSKPQEAPAPRPAPRPRPALVHVPGIGMVEVVAPDAGALRLGEMSTEERAAAIRKDPALLRELGLQPSPITPVAPTAPVAPITPVAVVAPTLAAPPPPPALAPPVVAPVVILPAVPDLEPTPARSVAVTSAESARADSATTPVVAAVPVEPVTLIGAVQKLVPAAAAAPGLAEQIPVINALRHLDPPAVAAPTNELQPFVDIVGQLMIPDVARTPAEPAQTDSKPQDAPPPRRAPALVYVPGLGTVEVVTPDANAHRLGDISTDERAAAIRKDPALLRALGIELPSSPVVAVAPATALAPPLPAPLPAPAFAPPVVTPAVVVPAAPDLEPTPVMIVATASAEPSPAASTTPPILATARSGVAAAPSEPVTAAAASHEPSAPPGPSTVGELASAADERVAIALPERMPEPEPEQPAKPDGDGAIDELQRLTLVSHEERVAALRKLPGLGEVAENFAHMLGGLTPDALRAMAQELGFDANGALAPTANRVAGH